MSERWYRAFGAEGKETPSDSGNAASFDPAAFSDILAGVFPGGHGGGPAHYTLTPHSAEYNSYFPFPPDNYYGLGPPPPVNTSSTAHAAHAATREWSEENRRRRNANKAAIGALQLGAQAGYCEPCEALTLIYAEDRRGRSEWLSANPHHAAVVSFQAIPTVPDACLSCTPQPAGWTPQDDLTPEQLAAALRRPPPPRPKAAPNLPVIIGVTAVGTLLLSRWLFRP